MTPEEAGKFIKCNVRVKPDGSRQHWGRARLVAVHGRRATILPWGHRTTIVVDLDELAVWKGGNPQMFGAATPEQRKPVPPKENPMPAPSPKSPPPATAPVPSMFTPELYVEAMQALKDLADAEQMARDAAADVVRAREKWQQLKGKLDEATKA